jgi:hypothetical protein
LLYKELAVVDIEVLDFRERDEVIGTNRADLALYIAFLVASIRIAELHAASE